MAVRTWNGIELCAGVGWLGLGIELACDCLGIEYRTRAYAERDSYAASVIVARMEDAALAPALVWDDLSTFDGRPWRGKIHCLSAGLPCPAFSVAGKQLGLSDERAWGSEDSPIPQFLRIIGEVEPAVVFIENVPPFVSGGHFRLVGERLCALGYEIETPLFLRASDVGAAHKRERVFILAHNGRYDLADAGCVRFGDENERRWEQRTSGAGTPGVGLGGATVALSALRGFGELLEPSRGDGQPDGSGDVLELTRSDGRGQHKQGRGQDRGTIAGGTSEPMGHARGSHVNGRESEQQPGKRPARTDKSVADPISAGQQERPSVGRNDGQERAAPERARREIFAPGPSDPRWGSILAERPWLAPATQQGVRYLVDGRAAVLDSERADALRCGGNGCVPLCVSVALIELMRRAGIVEAHHA